MNNLLNRPLPAASFVADPTGLITFGEPSGVLKI